MKDKLNFTDFFDIHNLYHIESYNHLTEKGVWPVDFIPDNVKMESGWLLLIKSKMADEYIKLFMNNISFE